MSQEIHTFTQRAYHFQSLADKGTSTPLSTAPAAKGAKGATTASDKPKTRFYVTSYSRDETLTSAFHELKEQIANVDADLASKYKLQNKVIPCWCGVIVH